MDDSLHGFSEETLQILVLPFSMGLVIHIFSKKKKKKACIKL
ncbi:unnamed protein product [Musa acuminata subsp. malaccensis]|uniref:(wild Malaysian banana) hypothetical protein n=1 Tax=Musa acuminata subsp. malaccensis TaxID=214687 RepID=A0A8D6ZWT4_MUSAM|nr:unnamed protein product [Musa acuminata subsp. malaccensis]